MDEFNFLPSDIIIAVMGPTGSGKTNFINSVTGNSEKTRGATPLAPFYTIMRHGHRIVLIETPAFDDEHRSDLEVLQITADRLTRKYPDGMTIRLAGVLYLHRITDNRMDGVPYKSFQIFGLLCGRKPLPRVRLVTTMWDLVPHREVAQRRETVLIAEVWRPLMDEGAMARRFENAHLSAFQIVGTLIDIEKAKDDLLLQEEIVKQGKLLNETEVGKFLYSHLRRRVVEQRKILAELADAARLEDNPALAKSLQEEYDQVMTSLQRAIDEMEGMKISRFRHIRLWLSGQRRTHAVKLGQHD